MICRLGAAYYLSKRNGYNCRGLKGVRQLTKEQRKTHETYFEKRNINGRLQNVIITQDKNLFDTNDFYTDYSGKGWAMFVLTLNNKIYTGSQEYGRFHHSSFMASSAVQAAGEWKVSKGLLVSVTNKSGHYKSTPSMFLRFLFFLYHKGIDLEEVLAVPIINRNDYNRYYTAKSVLHAGGYEPKTDPVSVF